MGSSWGDDWGVLGSGEGVCGGIVLGIQEEELGSREGLGWDKGMSGCHLDGDWEFEMSGGTLGHEDSIAEEERNTEKTWRGQSFRGVLRPLKLGRKLLGCY